MRHLWLGLMVAIAVNICGGDRLPAAAFERWLDGGAIDAAFKGQTIDGHYNDGTRFTESYSSDGRLDYREANRVLTGRWSVVNGTFCTIYETSPTGGCYRVTQVSANCYEFYFCKRRGNGRVGLRCQQLSA